MRKTIKSTHFELTPAISDYVEKKIVQSIEKLVGSDESVITDIEVGRVTAHHKHGNIYRAEVNIHGKIFNIRVEKEHADLYGAIDLVRDEVTRAIEQRLKRRNHIIRRGAAKIKSLFKKPESDNL
jgi:putative sigma-54 modulation protein